MGKKLNRKSKKHQKKITSKKYAVEDFKLDAKEVEGENAHFNNEVFKDLLFLIVSLLHGSLFFILCEKVIDLIKTFSFEKLSFIIFFFSIFLRIFQTHILAAIKYTDKWRFRPYDFILVFFTTLFEYLLFSLADYYIYFGLIFAFCAFGLLGYIITYIRTRKSFNKAQKATEFHLQLINMGCIFSIGIAHLLYFARAIPPEYYPISAVNYSSSIIFIINIYFSLHLSKGIINRLIKM